jgi:hypothetical protein
MRALHVVERCPECGAGLRVRSRHADGERFVSCGDYPRCRWAESIDARSQRLAERVAELEDELADAYLTIGETKNAKAAAPISVVDRELKALVFRWHPDRHPKPVDSTTLVAELNRVRELAA